MKNTAVLLITCPDRKGIVAGVGEFLYRHDANILHADQHQDAERGLFLMRVEWDLAGFDLELVDCARHFAIVAERYKMRWRIESSACPHRVAVFVSKYEHCLVDLLYRHQSGELACDIPLIISNHADNQAIADFYKIPYAIVSVTKENRQAAESKIETLIAEHKPDFMVL